MGGSKGGGGGGGTGKIDYPAHMKEFHSNALNHNGSDTVTSSMVDLLNVALATNPYSGILTYRGTTELNAMDTALGKVDAAATVAAGKDWVSAIAEAVTVVDGLFDMDTVDAVVEAYTDLLEKELETTTYPAFEAGMRDINAVMSSAFVIGKALIVEGKISQITKYDSELRHKVYLQRNEAVLRGADKIMEWYLKVFEATRSAAMFTVDVKKTRILAEREHTDQEIKVANIEATWEFESYMFAGNFLASIGGGIYAPGQKGMSTGQSAFSGILSGAGMGTQIGGTGWGTVIGGALGGIGGLLG